MASRKITASDVCIVTGYSRNELRWLLNELPPYCNTKPSPRVAREFTAKDLSVLSVVFVLENSYGMRLSAIVQIAELISDSLSKPKAISNGARLLICLTPPNVTYVSTASNSSDGIFLSLDPIFDKVDEYLMPALLPNQVDLNFGPESFKKEVVSNTGRR